MTQPNEAVTQEEVIDVAAENKKMEEFFKVQDARATIYAKHDAIVEAERKAEEPPREEPAKEEPEKEEAAQVPDEPTSEAATEPARETPEEEEVIDREEYERRTSKWKIKAKFDGEELTIPVPELVKDAGMSRKYNKRLAEVNRKERELLDRQYQAPPPPVAPSVPAPQGQPLPLYALTDDQVRERYNELALESPFDANAFYAQVQEARKSAQYQYAQKRAAQAQQEFFDSYGLTDDSPEWKRIDSREFYEKHPDIIEARDAGDFRGMFRLAHAYYREEQLSLKEEEVAKKALEKAKAKKEGQVLRVASKPEPPKPKTEEMETNDDYIRRIASDRRRSFGINRNFKT